MDKDILITSIIYFNQDLIKTHVDFLVDYSDKADVVILENPSHITKETSKYCIDLVKQKKLYKYLLFDENIGMNTFETFFESNLIDLEKYSYIVITDGDLIVKNTNWLNEQINIFKNYPKTYACGVKLDLSNIPSKKDFHDVNKWYPKSRQILNDCEVGETGLHLLMYQKDNFKLFLEYLKEYALTFMDTTMHMFCNMHQHKTWRRTKNSQAYHLTWDLYNKNDDYTKIKINTSREDLWYHGNYCDYNTYEMNSGKDVDIRRCLKYDKPKVMKQNNMVIQSKLKFNKRGHIKTQLAREKKERSRLIIKKVEKIKLEHNSSPLRILSEKKIEVLKNMRRESIKPSSIVKINKSNIYKTITKLHIGCGNNYFDNTWLNVDLLDVKPTGINYLFLDVLKKFPFKGVELIYCEHFIEHLTKEEGINFIKNCYKSLKIDGVLRIATFDLDTMIDNCHSTNNKWKEDCGAKKLGLDHTTRGEFLNMLFNAWGHKFAYNREDMEDIFRKGGFKNLTFCDINKSTHKDLCNQETRFNSKLIIEGLK
jgi:predicted SAM-dependent methyltransferase